MLLKNSFSLIPTKTDGWLRMDTTPASVKGVRDHGDQPYLIQGEFAPNINRAIRESATTMPVSPEA